MRFNFPLINGYSLRGVDDWLCFLTDANGSWFMFHTECDALWSEFPDKWARYAAGLGEGTGNPDNARHAREASECIAAIGLRKLQLGHKPRPVDPESVAGLERHFGRRAGPFAYQDGAEFYDSATGALIASYRGLVRGDYDMQGAQAARVQFLARNPRYRMDPNPHA